MRPTARTITFILAAMVGSTCVAQQPAGPGRRVKGPGTVRRPARPAPSTRSGDAAAVVKLQHADVASVAPILAKMGLENLTAAQDDRTNSVLLSGPPSAVRRAREVLAGIDALRPAPRGVQRLEVMQVQHARASEAAVMLKALVEDKDPGNRVMIVPDDKGNRLFVRGLAPVLRRAAEVLKLIDIEAPRSPVQFVRVERVDAATLATQLEQMFSSRLRAQETLEIQPLGPRRLSMAAPLHLVGPIKEMIAKLDVEFRDAAPAPAQFIEVEHVAAEAMVAKLEPLLRGGLRPGQDLHIEAVGPNRILLTAPAKLVPIAKDLLAKLDTNPEESAAFQRFQVNHLDPHTAATHLQRLLRARLRRGERLEIQPLDNRLLVTGPPRLMPDLQKLLAEIDVAAEEPPVQLLEVRHAPAASVARQLDGLFRSRVKKGERLTIQALDERRILLAAPKQLVGPIKEMIEKLDVPVAAPRQGELTLVYPLAHGSRESLLEGLRLALGDDGSIVSDRNSLIIKAPEDKHLALRKLLEKLDRPEDPPGGPMTTVTVPLVHREARRAIDIVTKTFQAAAVAVAIDQGKNRLVLRGPGDAVSQARDAIRQFDQPLEQYRFSFYLLEAAAAGIPTEGEKGPGPAGIPAPVLEELQRAGVRAPDLLARAELLAVEGDKGKLQSRRHTDTGLALSCELTLRQAGEWITVDLEVTVEHASADKVSKVVRPLPLRIGTTVRTKPGHYVVVGRSPWDVGAGRTVILVLRIDRVEGSPGVEGQKE